MGKPEQDMLSAPAVDLEQRDKNNKKKQQETILAGLAAHRQILFLLPACVQAGS